MSKTLVVFAHPSHQSFNYSLLETVVEGLRRNGHEIEIDDLHATNFDPITTAAELLQTHTPDQIAQEQAKVIWADTLLFIFPIWWWAPPAILKGWLERVLCRDFAFTYDIGKNRFVGTLDGRGAVIISTSSADPASYESNWQAESQTSYVKDIVEMCGIHIVKRINFCDVHAYTDAEKLKSYLQEAREWAENF